MDVEKQLLQFNSLTEILYIFDIQPEEWMESLDAELLEQGFTRLEINKITFLAVVNNKEELIKRNKQTFVKKIYEIAKKINKK